MYAGHFAAALAMKAREPRAPTWGLLLGAGFVDVLFGVFVVLGVEQTTITPGEAPGFRLDFIDWSHSMAMSALWAVVFGLMFLRRGKIVALWCGLAVFSHFVLDVLMHPRDLALWPHSTTHVGLGFWTRWPIGWWFFEFGFIAICSAYYAMRARRVGGFGGRAWAVILIVIALHIFNSPWLAPV